jgi:hypothetical protein
MATLWMSRPKVRRARVLRMACGSPVAQSILTVPQVAMRAASQNKETKERVLDLAGLAQRCCVLTQAQAGLPVLLKGVFAFRRKLSPGLKVQVMFQGRTYTFAPAVENYSPTARQMLYLRGTVENGTGRF